MAGEKVTAAADAAKGKQANDSGDGRQRSTIGFPYNDLGSAIEMAEAIHNQVGLGECEDDQLAAWTNQSAKSSGFRVQLSAARMFGLLETTGGRHRLTELGKMIVDPKRAREARVRAFMTVPLYKAVYEKYKGGVIPPAAALERDMAALGVAEKIKDRARQAFERSAERAGFFEQGRNRLVMPGLAAHTEDGGRHESGDDNDEEAEKGSRGGSDGGSGDPLIAALIKKLPPSGTDWSADERVMWLHMMAMAFQMAYGPKEQIDIKKSGGEL